MAERMLRREITVRGLDVEVSSCGILFDGAPASDAVIAVLGERGLDAVGHRSRKFVPSMIDGIDLVVTMERSHIRELVVSTTGTSARIHTLGALVAWLRSVEHNAEASPSDRVAEFATDRRPSHTLGSGPDEVSDPHGKSNRVHRKAADLIDDLCGGLLVGLFPHAAGPDIP